MRSLHWLSDSHIVFILHSLEILVIVILNMNKNVFQLYSFIYLEMEMIETNFKIWHVH